MATTTHARTAIEPQLDWGYWKDIETNTSSIAYGQFEDVLNWLTCAGEEPTAWKQLKSCGADGLPKPAQTQGPSDPKAAPGGQPARTASGSPRADLVRAPGRLALPFPGVDPYRQLKAAAEGFLLWKCRPLRPGFDPEASPSTDANHPIDPKTELKLTADDPEKYRTTNPIPRDAGAAGPSTVLATIAAIIQNNGVAGLTLAKGEQGLCGLIDPCKLECPMMVELIWTYWMEEAGLFQTSNALLLRFQNVKLPMRDPLLKLKISALRNLANVMWGFVQDDQHRLSVTRRAYEYQQQYGLPLVGRALRDMDPSSRRAPFLDAFHGLLHQAAEFYVQDANTQIVADGFPMLESLRGLHLVLHEGFANQYGDLTWTSRQEALMYQWLLSRPEIVSAFGDQTSPLPEAWMQVVDQMRSLQGWPGPSTRYYATLATSGERILLSARWNAWIHEGMNEDNVKQWARFFRKDIQQYISAYRAVTGVDLSKGVETTPPATLIQRRGDVRPAAK